MKSSLFKNKFLTLIGLSVITLSIILTTILVINGSLLNINAAAGQNPKEIEITNVSDVSFTISYITDNRVAGTLNYGTDPGILENVVLDDRDQLSQTVNEYKIHSISVKDLNPETVYYFSITSGDKKFLDKRSPFNIKTGNIIDNEPSNYEPLSGRVVIPDGSTPEEGLIYVSIPGAQKLSSYIKNNGNYIVPLNTLRNKSLNSYYSIDKNAIINLDVTQGNLYSSVSVSPNEINPVSLITLSNNYDFSSNNGHLTPTDTPNSANFPSMGATRNTLTAQNLTPTPSPSKSPVETPTPIPSPTIRITPTLTPTLTPSISVTPIPTIPATGNSSAIITTFAGFATLASGIVLFLLSRGQKIL